MCVITIIKPENVLKICPIINLQAVNIKAKKKQSNLILHILLAIWIYHD